MTDMKTQVLLAMGAANAIKDGRNCGCFRGANGKDYYFCGGCGDTDKIRYYGEYQGKPLYYTGGCASAHHSGLIDNKVGGVCQISPLSNIGHFHTVRKDQNGITTMNTNESSHDGTFHQFSAI